jgi:hypothetical protein
MTYRCDYLDRRAADGCKELAVRDVLRDALNINSFDDPRAAAAVGDRVAEALNRCSWFRVGRTGRGDNRRTLYRMRPPR